MRSRRQKSLSEAGAGGEAEQVIRRFPDQPDFPKTPLSVRYCFGLLRIARADKQLPMAYANIGPPVESIHLACEGRALAMREIEIEGYGEPFPVPEHRLASFQEANRLNQRVFVLWQAGKQQDALPLAAESVSICRELFGTEHHDYAFSLFNLAAQHRDLRDSAKAEALFGQARDAYKRALGAEHPRYAFTLTEMAMLYWDSGRHAEAEPLFSEVVNVNRKVFGQKSSEYAASLNHLGGLYQTMGQNAEIPFSDDFLPKGSATRLGSAEATEEELRRRAPEHRYLHLATHGFFSPLDQRSSSGGQPAQQLFGSADEVTAFHPDLMTGIVLAGANRGPQRPDDPIHQIGDDGILTGPEVAALDLADVELAVLSACETGLGHSTSGEGLISLQRAFQIAGTRTVVASLWKVDDDATRTLMVEFYKNLWEKKLGKLEALRQAQLTMLREYDPQTRTLRGPGKITPVDPDKLAEARETSNSESRLLPPFYWAAFVLSGDWQ